MKQTKRGAAAVAAVASLVLALQGLDALAMGPQAFAAETIRATTTVNVRSGPSTTRAIIGYVAWGWTIEATGPSTDGWTPVDYNGRAGYVSSQYFTYADSGSTLGSGPTGQARTTAALNVRVGPSTSHSRVEVLPYGAAVTLTGVTSNGFSQIVWGSVKRWVSTSWIQLESAQPSQPATPETTPPVDTPPVDPPVDPPTDPAPVDPPTDATPTDPPAETPPPEVPAEPETPPVTEPGTDTPPETVDPTPETPALPAVVGQRRATTALMLRSSSAADFYDYGDIPTGTIVDITGLEENGVAQIVWHDEIRWVNAKYLAEVTAPAPGGGSSGAVATGQLYTTANLNVRTQPSVSSTKVGLINAGTAVDITGATENGWYQIIYSGTTRWVSGDYLSETKPTLVNTGGSVGLQGLTPYATEVVRLSQANFPQIYTYYGQAYRTGVGDHDMGRAVDIMLPNYRSNQALGEQIAAFFQARAVELNINYIIFNQHIWSVARSREGWRWMADRGSDTENHVDHVHISVNP
ncbi:MAG: SH3 domain-containing protein [Propionibacteriaceae bacterium]|nr:SH3 domain-containing protein [Propionibacteriaceae bacterium]